MIYSLALTLASGLLCRSAALVVVAASLVVKALSLPSSVSSRDLFLTLLSVFKRIAKPGGREVS
jgi:hypothetical protein